MLLALPVDSVNIRPIGRGIPWGEPWVLASCHIMAQTTDWVVYGISSVGVSLTQGNMGPGPPKFTKDVSKG